MVDHKLTASTHGGGCACKLSAKELRAALSGLRSHPVVSHPNLLVGIGTSDDASVWRLSDEMALVSTVDFFTPMVDEPYDWGRIAAANALSDVYAMGGRPISALQLIGWPRAQLATGALAEVVRGGADAMADAGCAIVGGHSIDSPEPLYGFAVTGVVAPGSVLTNADARPGDLLVLTKRLGTGIITGALKRGLASSESVAAAVSSMTSLNAAAAEAIVGLEIHAVTDVTGFGLLGHLHEMLEASQASARLDAGAIPVLVGAMELAASGSFPGGSARNLADAESFTDFRDADPVLPMILADAQTSGGLLIAVAPASSAELITRLEANGAECAAVIGEVVAGNPVIEIRSGS